MTRIIVALAAIVSACSSSSSSGASLNRTEKVAALSDADLPVVCDAWAADVGGYGAPTVTKDCGNATSSAEAPASQAACVTAFQQDKAQSSCTATVGGFLDCKKALYDNPCATVAEAPTCTVFFTSDACRAP